MKLKSTCIAVSLFTVSLPVIANDINRLQNLNQGEFRLLSEDLAAALSYKPLIPTGPLGITGFDLGLAVTDTKLNNSGVFNKATSGNVSSAGELPVPSLRLNKGLPFDVDVGFMLGAIPGSNIRLWGGELRYAFVHGDSVTPAIGLRGSYTKLTGVDQLGLETKGVDLSISKGFLMFTPYAGIGKVWTTSTPNGVPAFGGGTLQTESFSLNKVFGGVNLNFGLTNLVFEADRTGNAHTFGGKLGFRF